MYNRRVPISYLVFDLDDTLYPANGLWEEIGKRIVRFMIERLDISPAEVDDRRQKYFLEYGTTLRGLRADFPGVDADDYLAYVHDVDLTRWIAPNPALDAMLAALPQSKAIFTNSDAAHAGRVLNCIGVAQHFNAVVDIRAMGFENKPLPRSYEILLERIETPANECVLIDDLLRNLLPARELGMTTILVGNGHAPHPAVDFSVHSVLQIAEVIAQLTLEK